MTPEMRFKIYAGKKYLGGSNDPKRAHEMAFEMAMLRNEVVTIYHGGEIYVRFEAYRKGEE